MKISYNWLKTIIPVKLNPEEVGKLLTDCGLEVEGIEEYSAVKGNLEGVIVGQVIKKEKHPDADRLNLTEINIGTGENLKIVCGAANVAEGQKVLVATVGCTLYPTNGEPLQIKKSKIRGAISEGMICAEDELGIGASHDGIMVLPNETPVGIPASQYFNFEKDYIFEIGLTPNRGDAASHYGVAIDLAAVLAIHRPQESVSVKLPGNFTLPASSNVLNFTIEVQDTVRCPRYSGLTISGIKVAPSPKWLADRITSIGLRPINNIVDITNFVLHETGQPLHAFDAFKIKGKKVIVRTALPGEKMITLDDEERNLHQEDLLICDEQSPMCIAGVFGGKHSGVSDETQAIFLESAFFSADSIRKTSKRHALKTDASFRFERGTDPELTVKALMRATELILEIAGGQVSSNLIDLYPKKAEPVKVAFSYQKCYDLIGKEIEKSVIKTILNHIGIEIDKEGTDALVLSIPSRKSDVTRPADVIEEIMRIYGYNSIEPSAKISFTPPAQLNTQHDDTDNRIAALLTSNGFIEIMSTSLSKEKYAADKTDVITLVNPLSSDLNIMRQSMLYSGLEAISYNQNRKASDLKLFEFGRTYAKQQSPEFPYTEEKHLTVFVTGNKFPENHYGMNEKTSFYYLKGLVQSVFDYLNISGITISEEGGENYTYGLKFYKGKKLLCEAGLVNKSLCKLTDCSGEIFAADFMLSNVYRTVNSKIIYNEVSKFPEVRRDLALVLDKNKRYSELVEVAYATERKLLKDMNLFDVYEGNKIASDKKSYAVSFTLQDKEATLTDKQIEHTMDKLLKAFREKLSADLR